MFCARLSRLTYEPVVHLGPIELRSEDKEGFENHTEEYTMPRPSRKATPTPRRASAPVQVPVLALSAPPAQTTG